jgi:hypothetical protein
LEEKRWSRNMSNGIQDAFEACWGNPDTPSESFVDSNDDEDNDCECSYGVRRRLKSDDPTFRLPSPGPLNTDVRLCGLPQSWDNVTMDIMAPSWDKVRGPLLSARIALPSLPKACAPRETRCKTSNRKSSQSPGRMRACTLTTKDAITMACFEDRKGPLLSLSGMPTLSAEGSPLKGLPRCGTI